MALNDKVQSRLLNWKFDSAAGYLNDDPDNVPDEPERELVEALALTFGNSGWFDGSMGMIISAAVSTLLDTSEGDDDANAV